MSHQQYPPQQPGWGGPQQPYGAPPPFQPLPPKKTSAGKVIGLGCLGLVGVFVLVSIVAAIIGLGSTSSDSSGSNDVAPVASSTNDDKPAADDNTKSGGKKASTQKKTEKKVVTFKVWGTAPAGALGPLDITYGSDSDSRDGHFKNGKFEATLPLNNDALFYSLTAQLQGSGDIHCSVTINGHTKKGHASGDYNICDAQLNSGLFGGWD